MSDTLQDVRSVILNTWNVSPDSGGFSEWERNNLAAYWDELKAVEEARAWRATAALAGQLIEAHLKQRLLRNGRPFSTVSYATLDPLIKMAIADGIFSGDALLTIAGSVFAAKQLRNFASHGTAWSAPPTELNATHALVFLACYSGWIFPPSTPDSDIPTDADDSWWKDNVDAVHPNRAAEQIQKALATEEPSMELLRGLIKQILGYGGPGAVDNLYRTLWKRGSSVLPSVTELTRLHFADIVSNAGRGRIAHIESVSTFIRSFGLPIHSSCLAACLPRTPDALAYYLKRSPIRFARYLQLCRAADARSFERSLSSPETRVPLVRGLERLVRHRVSNIAAFAIILQRLPRPTVEHVLVDSSADILEWAREESAWNSASLLKTLISPHLRRISKAQEVRNDILHILNEKIERSSLQDLGSLPMRLNKLGLIDEASTDSLLEALLTACLYSQDYMEVQRVLWDFMQFVPQFQKRAQEMAEQILRERADLPPWPLLCLAGALQVFEKPSPVALSPDLVAAAVREGRDHRWELFRVALACARSTSEVHVAATPVFQKCAEVVGRTQAGTSASMKLLDAVRLIVDHVGK